MKFFKILIVGFVLAAASAPAATVMLVDSPSSWRWRPGSSEASAPTSAWRGANFDDSVFTTANAPFWYGDVLTGGTQITGMSNVYTSIFLRKALVLSNVTDIASLRLGYRCDDGFIAWINGVEVFRYNMPAGAVAYNGVASGAVAVDPAPLLTTDLSAAATAALVNGTNVLAVHAFNAALGSSDLGMAVTLEGTLDETAPTVLFQLPFAGSTVTALGQIEVDFSENVAGVNAADLLINSQPATNVTATSGSVYVFRFPPQSPGTVNVQFATGHAIQDLASMPHPFAGASWSYVVDPNYVPPQTVRLNELLAANVNGLRDENNEPQDWVELKNTGSNAISLAGWSLTDEEDTPDKWVFPSITLPGGGLLIVFCSEKDRKPITPGSRLHTNFKLDPDGEFLGLYNAESPRQLVSSFNPYPNQRRDYSYGYDPAGQLRYFAAPSPGTNNPASSITGIVADTKFSVNRGFYTNGFFLSVTCATPGVTIRYTTSGTAPTPSSGTIYSGPIQVTNTSVIRALASKAGLLESDVDCQTYLFLADVIRQPDEVPPGPGWPAQKKPDGGGQNIDYGMDQSIVNSALYSNTIRSDLMAIPSVSIVMDLAALFNASTGIYVNPGGDTITWERPCSLELIQPDDEPGFQINCGIRIRGGFSRSANNPKHAFRLFFRQEYGASKLNFPMFGPTGAESFDKFDLRTMQNYSWSFGGDGTMMCMRDVSSRDAQLAMNGLGTRGRFIHLYLNGVYWGLYNTEERPEAAFAESYIGGNADDYDVIKQLDGYISGATDGDTAAWYRLWQAATNGFASDVDYFKVQGLNVDGTVNTNYENLVDVPNMIDYMLVIIYGGNLDAPISNFLGNDSPNNWYGFRDRTGRNGGFRFISHDAEHTLLANNPNVDRTGIVDLSGSGGVYGVINSDWTCGNPLTQVVNGVYTPSGAQPRSTPQYIWFRMHQNPEFRILAADRIQKHFYNGGPLSVTGMRALLHSRSNEIERAIVGESARWGDAKREPAYERATWLGAYNTVLSGFVNGRTATVLGQLTADGLFPSVSAPTFSHYGGAVSNGFAFRMTNNVGSSALYYTLDGTDPRLRGGAISTSALAYTPGSPLIINFPTTVRARVRSNAGVWSAITEAVFYPGQDFSRLMVSEIMFNPPAMGATLGDELEFLELKNAGTNTLDLTGIEFTDAITYTFPIGSRLLPGQFLVLGRNRDALTNKYPGLVVHGLYTGHLNNGGELITMQAPLGGEVLSVDYKNGGRWPITPDGFGFSLVPRNPNSSPNPDNPSNWRASTNPGGSPGADDPASAVPSIVINEALTHSTPAVDYVELHNPGPSDVNVGGWFLTDDRALPMKYRIPNGTMIPGGGFLVLDESHFNPTPGTNGSFSLNGEGEAVYLLAGDAATNLIGYSHGFTFDAAPAGVSFGRHVISTGDDHFVLQTSTTMNAANSGPRIGPIVIRQIMYHPPDLAGGLDNSEEEFIELRNITGGAVQLFDPAFSTNTWRVRGGVQFNFPPALTLGAGQSLVLAGFDPADTAKLTAFRNRYGSFAGVPIHGPWTGKLDNSSDTVELRRPDAPTPTNGVPYYAVDVVDYKDAAPWPSGADGSGAALQRVSLTSYANDPANWIGAAPLTIFGIAPGYIAVRAGTNAATATNVTFAVTAVGTGALGYQWRKDGAVMPGATSDAYTVLDAQLDDAGYYSVVVSDLSGSAVSPDAYLGVVVMPTFLQRPLSQIAVSNQIVTLSVVIAGSPPPFTYVWKRGSATNAVFVSNSTTNYYSYVVTNAPGGQTWRVHVHNTATAEAVPPLTDGVSYNPVTTITILADTDKDGIPDAWETAYGLDPNSAADAAIDSDGDGMINLAEYVAGTDPSDNTSYLKVNASLTGGMATVTFEAVTNRTYVLEFKDNLTLPVWTRLAEFPARYTTNRMESFIDPHFTTNRFYRLGTPRLP